MCLRRSIHVAFNPRSKYGIDYAVVRFYSVWITSRNEWNPNFIKLNTDKTQTMLTTTGERI